jgi:hypothetical protein
MTSYSISVFSLDASPSTLPFRKVGITQVLQGFFSVEFHDTADNSGIYGAKSQRFPEAGNNLILLHH